MPIFVGIKQQEPGYKFTTGGYESYQVILVQSGRVDTLVHKEVIPVFPGGVIVLPVGSVFSLSCAANGSGYRGVYAILPDAAAPPAVEEPEDFCQGPACVVQSTPAFRQLGDVILAQLRNPGYNSQGLQQFLGRALLEFGRCLAAKQQFESGAGNESAEYWVDRAAQAIETGIYSNQQVLDLLAELGLSYRQLARHFRKEKGMTPKQYHLRSRLNEARRVLAGTRQPVSNIAMDLGFASSQHLATAFRQAFHCTPTAYRARHRCQSQ